MNPHYPQPKKIKSLHTQQVVTIKSLFTYQNFLIRRPKNTITFKFSWQSLIQIEKRRWISDQEKKAQIKLLETLNRLKHFKKVDLLGFQCHGFKSHQTLSESIYKKIAKVKSLSVTRKMNFLYEKKPLMEKWLKHFAGLQNLHYSLSVNANFEPIESLSQEFTDPLGHLKYCHKVQSLSLDISGAHYFYKKFFIKFGYFPTSLKHLSIQSSLSLYQLNLPLEKLQQLQSINLSLSSDHWGYYMNALSNLPFLQDLNLTIHFHLSPIEFLTIWRKITTKKQLKKLHLFFGFNFPTTPDLFQALSDCQLTHLSLRLYTSDHDLLHSISQCLNHQPQLQSLTLQIRGSFSFNEAQGFPKICSQIPYLEDLRHLQLYFIPHGRLNGAEKVPHFISYFQKIFEKPIKLETLSLCCHQADPEIMLKELISALKGSCSSLQSLKVYLSCPIEDSSFLELLLPNLKNIREIELPGLNVNNQKALKIMVEAAETLENLRALEIGQIGGTIMKAEYADGIERILKKRGLRRFLCKTDRYITDENIKIDTKGILRKNPFLEDAKMFYGLGGNLSQDIFTWI